MIWCEWVRLAAQHEVIRAILFDNSPCCGGGHTGQVAQDLQRLALLLRHPHQPCAVARAASGGDNVLDGDGQGESCGGSEHRASSSEQRAASSSSHSLSSSSSSSSNSGDSGRGRRRYRASAADRAPAFRYHVQLCRPGFPAEPDRPGLT